METEKYCYCQAVKDGTAKSYPGKLYKPCIDVQTCKKAGIEILVDKPIRPLEQAIALTTGDRQEAYGHPSINFTNISKGWSVIIGHAVTPEQVALCMIWTKICRELNKPDIDNLINMAGYVNTLQMVKEAKE